ncbi:FkbM family methyltransferase [Saccharospirillum alexandrii]|uniref:FkbM family methyltransferase n=1 Tax=Saccharospirillum alexandrii TaxID=2448477 RepID=UPI0013DFF9D0|nr:FkbM family methyltransferase [Saccharospirillum alexandrii]
MTDLLSENAHSRHHHPRPPSVRRSSLKRPAGYVRSEYGILLRKNWLDATFHFCSTGAYDHFLADFLRQQQRPFALLDIGANQGLYSILAGLNPNCQQVLAFEPVSSTFSLLTANIAINGVDDVVKPVKAAVSLSTGKATIAKKPGHSGAASLRTLPGWFRLTETIATLGPEALRELLPTHVDLIIKVDVEGHEHTVFKALSQAGILAHAAAVFYEVNPEWSQESALKTLLQAHGFTGFTRTSSRRCHDVLATR